MEATIASEDTKMAFTGKMHMVIKVVNSKAEVKFDLGGHVEAALVVGWSIEPLPS